MNGELVKRALEIVDEAIFLGGDARHAYVEQACGDDPDLRAEVNSILRHEMGLSIVPAHTDEPSRDDPWPCPCCRFSSCCSARTRQC